MSTSSLDIYNLLVDAGIEAKKAEPLAKEILTRSEAKEFLVTKNDLWKSLFTTSVAIVTANLAGITIILQIFFAGGN